MGIGQLRKTQERMSALHISAIAGDVVLGAVEHFVNSARIWKVAP
jgi:hypothetical protein